MNILIAKSSTTSDVCCLHCYQRKDEPYGDEMMEIIFNGHRWNICIQCLDELGHAIIDFGIFNTQIK
jgi:hypothetical protein